MNPRISLVTLGVSDLDRSTTFYRDGLGLPADTSNEGVAFFRLNGSWLSLFPFSDLVADAHLPKQSGIKGFGGITLAHNVASKEEVGEVFEQALAAGAKPLKPPQDAVWGGYHAYFADLDDYVWEIAWNPQFDLTGGF